MESLLVNLKKQVTCSICLDTYSEPKTISCLHTFCCECLEKHARVSQRQGKFRCPECQAVCWVFSLFDKVARQVVLLAINAAQPTLRCTTASIADDSCALIVSTHMKCSRSLFKDIKSRQFKTSKQKITKHCWGGNRFVLKSSTREKLHSFFARSVRFAFVKFA